MDDKMKSKYFDMILYIDSGAISLVFLFMISFCVDKNECCSSDEDINNNFAIDSCYGACICCDCCDYCCKCPSLTSNNGAFICYNSNPNDNKGGAILLLLIFFLIFLIFYVIYKGCGKHGSRIFFLILLSLDYSIITVYAFQSKQGTNYDIYQIAIMAISLFTGLSNILGIILPNCCKKLSYQYVGELYPIDNNNLNDNNFNHTQKVSSDFDQPILPIDNRPSQTNDIYNNDIPQTIYKEYNNYENVPSPNDNNIDASGPYDEYPRPP